MSLGARIVIVLAIAVSALALCWTISAETPVGTLRGRIVAQETGAGISAWVQLVVEPVRHDSQGLPVRYGDQSSSDGRFLFSRIPAGEYTLHASTKAHKLAPTTVTIEEGKVQTIEVELTPGEPTFSLYVHQHIFTPDERAQVTCHGFAWEASTVGLSIYKVDPEQFLKDAHGSIHRLVGLRPYDYKGLQRADLRGGPGLTPVGSFDSTIKNRDSEGVFTERIDLPLLKPGFYVVQAEAGGIRSLDWVLITGLGLVAKMVGSATLAYVVNLKTGIPTPAAVVEVYANGQTLASGTTDSRGLVALMSSFKDGGGRTILARSGDSFAFTTAWAERPESANLAIYSYTDRPVYRPGQRVYFRSIARKLTDEEYEVEANSPVQVEVRDPVDNIVYQGSGNTDRFGSYYAYLDLNPEASSGYYTLKTQIRGRDLESGFRVISYRKPEFSVKVKFAKKRYLRGERVKATIYAQYYFGAPVANAKVSYSVSRSPFWPFGPEEDWESDYEDYGGYGERVTQGDVRADENGEAIVDFVVDWPKAEENDPWDSDQLFSVDCYVTDQSNQVANGSGSLVATRGEFDVNIEPTSCVVAPGDEVAADITLRYYGGKPVRKHEVEVGVAWERWLPSGETIIDVLKRIRTRTDSSGRASVSFKPNKHGYLRVTASGVDRRGNTVTGVAYVWCWSETYGEIEGVRYSDLQVFLDKKTYNPGDTAKVLINTSKPGPTALVTVEGDRIRFVKTVELKGNSTSVEIPVKSTFKPNFYVGVCFVRNKKFISQEARARVSLADRELRVRVVPDRKVYRPGEKAVYKIRATDSRGRPAVAQVSVGVVDEAIYAILEDTTEPILDYFFARKPNSVNTNFSFPQIYLSDPDKAGAPSAKPEPRMRRRFRDTAYWAPAVVTNAKGEASVSFTMPDNLTTWRATARGITTNTLCGQTKCSVKTQQPVLVRLEAPRFMVQTDRAVISAAVHNYSGRNQSVNVNLTAPGLQVSDTSVRRVSVKNGGVERLDWQVTAPKSGEFKISVMAKGDTAGDAMQITLPVHPHAEERREVRVGNLAHSGSAVETLIVRADAVPGATKLRIRLAPSLASSMLGSLDYLATYPYGCTEQTTSAFIPNVVLWKSFKDLGVMNPLLQAKLPDMVSRGLFRLYRFQLPEGGWSWCDYGKPDLWMSAYVCYGLITARRAGFQVNGRVLNFGLEQLGQLVAKDKSVSDKTAYARYVLSLAGYGTAEWFESALGEEGTLSSRTLALAAMALQQYGSREKAREALKLLFARSVRQRGLIYWRGSREWTGDDIETTALALQAALAVDANDPRAAEIVRWLMKERTGNYWLSTRHTAGVLYALTEYLKSTRELEPDFDVKLKLNGRTLRSLHFGKESVLGMDQVVTTAASDLRKGRNSIALTKSGPGNLYYSLELTQYAARKSMPARVTGSGLTIAREYFSSNRISEERGAAITGCRTGDVVLVRLTVRAARRVDYAMLDDYIPAGCEIVDKGDVGHWEWDHWYDGRDIRDNKVSFYLSSVPVGRSIIEYRMRAGFPGSYHAPPARLFAMYEPTLTAATAESEFAIR